MFKKIPHKYRPVPFWSWNEKLDTEETKEQVRQMNSAGIGGFFMHARGGLQTEYMGEEWFDNVKAAIDAAKDLGMHPWAYDENGWPSGFGNGKVNGLGVEYQQKYLRMESEPTHPETQICQSGAHSFYYEINQFYVDILDKKVTQRFIDEVYEPYYEKCGNEIVGFFTDEPQVSYNGIPWSFVFEDEYQKRYGEVLTQHLEALFLPVGDYKKTRFQFWKMVSDLFSESYMKPVYDWCSARGLKLTGHLLCEDTLESQLMCSGASMPQYEYFHIPGMDWLCRPLWENLTSRQLGSVAEQLGKEAVLSETFALCGHNVSFDELKGNYEWQMVRGTNLLCQHLEGYSIRGIRKRDYPPALHHQQPWWKDYHIFNDAMSREGMLLAQGKAVADVLLIHPMSTAWTLFDCGKNEGLAELDKAFLKTIKTLERKHIVFHLGDETIMQRHAYVENGRLVIGKQQYSTVILPKHDILFPSTQALLEQFQNAGGSILTEDTIAPNAIIDNCDITYAKRIFDDFTLHFFVNSSGKSRQATFSLQGEKLDIVTGDLLPFYGEHTFAPWGSLMVVEKGQSLPQKQDVAYESIALSGEYAVDGIPMNSITLDKCDYYFDGVLCEKNGYVLNICERANLLERGVKIHQDFFVNASYTPEKLYLVCETPEKFEISVNGVKIPSSPCGHYLDKSFKMLDIAKYLKLGKNTISFDCDFYQSEEFYQNLKNAFQYESEKNKLSYESEIEAVYLVGEFGVKTAGVWTELNYESDRYAGEFEICAPTQSVNISNLQRQGFPFFCGSIRLSREIDVCSDHVRLVFDKRGVNVIEIEANGRKKTVLWNEDVIDISDIVEKGKQTVTVTLTNNLRNILGPHHLQGGEVHRVGPFSFYKEPCVWNNGEPIDWNDDYCFVKFGCF